MTTRSLIAAANRTSLAICALALAGSALAQDVPLPPKPADNGPSLADTMKFIQDKIASIGTANYVVFIQNTKDGSSFNNSMRNEVTGVVADPRQCKLSFHWKAFRDGKSSQDVDSWFSLSHVQDIVVKPYERYQIELDASLGNPQYVTTSVNPPVTALLVRRDDNATHLFPFIDPTLADRVAKALTHAVELCGGGNKDPF
jgi:hypothetical protein